MRKLEPRMNSERFLLWGLVDYRKETHAERIFFNGVLLMALLLQIRFLKMICMKFGLTRMQV